MNKIVLTGEEKKNGRRSPNTTRQISWEVAFQAESTDTMCLRLLHCLTGAQVQSLYLNTREHKVDTILCF